jgi:hypothetical protein
LGGDPLRPARHPRGKFRFDAPRDGAEYAVTYANLADHGAFAEVYGDTQLISELETTRRLSALVATRPLNLIALDDPTVQKTLKLDGRIAMSKLAPPSNSPLQLTDRPAAGHGVKPYAAAGGVLNAQPAAALPQLVAGDREHPGADRALAGPIARRGDQRRCERLGGQVRSDPRLPVSRKDQRNTNGRYRS